MPQVRKVEVMRKVWHAGCRLYSSSSSSSPAALLLSSMLCLLLLLHSPVSSKAVVHELLRN
jgi:hypothetical protein